MLKKKWNEATVKDICNMQNGHGFGPNDWDTSGLPIIRIQNLNGGQSFDYFSGTPDDRWLVEKGDLLFSWAGTKGVSFGPSVWRGSKGVLNQHIFKVKPKIGINADWLYWALRYVTDRIEGNAHGFKSTLVHVKKSDIENQAVNVPNKYEQRYIASILSTWDQSIVIAKKMIEKSQKQKLSLTATLMSGRRRLGTAIGQWKYMDFDTIFERVKRKNNIGNLNVLTISGERGLISQRDYFKKNIASSNLTGYTLVERGEFAYNKSYSAGYPMGAIKPLLQYDSGVVSSLYLCFRLRADADASLDFFRHYFEAGFHNQEIESIAQEGARNHGLLNVSVTDFFKLRLHIPDGPEQRRIAEVINVAEAEELRYKSQLRTLLIERQALMQQLLSGKRRVHLPDSETVASA